MIVENIYDNSIDYIKDIEKTKRKHIGQFFTPAPVAKYMASLSDTSDSSVRILDAGAGSGILTAALCEHIVTNSRIKNIDIDLYENNEDVLPLLISNVKYIKDFLELNNKKVNTKIIPKNFILSNSEIWTGKKKIKNDQLYNIIISNPPYKKIRKSSKESQAMLSIVYGQPNIYFLFMAMSAKLLKEDGEMIYITPRSFTSGAYFKEFRKWFFNNMNITNLNIFVSRSDVFNFDEILQEIIITKAIKTNDISDDIIITEIQDLSFDKDLIKHTVPNSILIDRSNDNYFMKIPTNEEDIKLLEFINQWESNLISLGFRLKTGPVVSFRSTEFLKENETADTVPLFWANNFDNNKLNHPIDNNKKPQYIMNNNESSKLLVKNHDYILLKRFTSKEEKRRIQPVLYFSHDFNYNNIGLENHLNYIVNENGKMTKIDLYGIYTILNSTYIDKYYRILNGNTQVNANEVNSMPFPCRSKLTKIGELALQKNKLDVLTCDGIISDVFDSKNIRHAI